MKPIISNDLKNRINFAAANGSIIASDLATAIKACRDINNENARNINYFDSKRIVGTCGDGRKTIRIVVTCCRKDLSDPRFPDHGNPQAPYFPENRSDITPHDFALIFKTVADKNDNGGYSSPDWTYFDSAMRLASKVKFRIGNTMADFIKAYDFSNYVGLSESQQSTLHSSCMRSSETARNAADYYVNFAGAKILIGETPDGEVVSRALLWDNMLVRNYRDEDLRVSFLDRTYTAFDGFLLQAMRDFALKNGYKWRKTVNDYCHKTSFTPMENIDFMLGEDPKHFEKDGEYRLYLSKQVPAIRMHKFGCPYCDTMSWLYYDTNTMQMTIANSDSFQEIGCIVADLANTGCYAERARHICPVCGKTHSNTSFCDDCESKILGSSPFGEYINAKMTTYKGKTIPAVMLYKGKPTPAFNAYITLERLVNSRTIF